jgi:hypothetical protein
VSAILQVVSPEEVAENERQLLEDENKAVNLSDQAKDDLAAFLRQRFFDFQDHRNTATSQDSSIEDRQLQALRTYNGQYSPQKKQQIAAFGGSEVFSRISSIKCRGATALLRDIFLGESRSWELSPTPIPKLPDDIEENIDQLLSAEIATLVGAEQPIDARQVRERRNQLMEAAGLAAIKEANKEAKKSQAKLNDLLVQGGFYNALREFLSDLPIFLFACIKGPVVHAVDTIKWEDGEIKRTREVRPYWKRVSPFDLFLSPGASSIEVSEVFERQRLSRAELNALKGVPGYNDKAIDAVLEDYGQGGLYEWTSGIETEQAEQENKESPHENQTGLIDTLEYHGPVQGRMLLDYGFTSSQVKEPENDYYVTAWLIGRHIIKVQLNPNANNRNPYYITSFEKVPGSMVGHGIPDIIEDSQDVANAALRSLVNNMSIASGPQVGYNEDRMSPTQDSDNLYPWKRWKFKSDPMGNNDVPLQFFQPESNSAELLGVYHTMQNIADETSGIPRYVTGSEKVGGAGSTASGLAMLMNNASKVLQNVAYNVDNDIIRPCLEQLYEYVMLTDETGMLRGDEEIVVRGVSIALQRETDRVRQLEFLQVTGNEIDMGIIGMDGRAAILRELASGLGMPGHIIVPSEEELSARKQAEQTAMQEQAAMAQAQQGPMPGTGQAGQPGETVAGIARNNTTPSARPRVG